MAWEIVFWVSCALIGYAYIGYPLLLAAYTRVKRRPVGDAHETAELPRITVLVAARNEAERLPAKLDDIFRQDYPMDRMQVLVVSDGSDDDTVDVLSSYADRGVECVALEQRRGKEAAQAEGIRRATGDFVIFTDVATRIGGDGLQGMVDGLRHADVGAVSSEDRFITTDGRPVGEGLYVRYEMWLRRLESKARGLVGLSGSLFGVRRELCDEWPTDVPSDLVVALRCARNSLRAISLQNVHGLYPDLKNEAAEFSRKRRTVVRGMAGLASAPEVLSPRRHGWFAFQVWSHKVLRWAVPWLMLLALVANVMLYDAGPHYSLLLALQCLAYLAVAIAALYAPLRRFAPIRLVYFFVVANLALAVAAIDFVRGRRVVFWEPSVR